MAEETLEVVQDRILINCEKMQEEVLASRRPNKAAAQRARRLSLNLAADFKKYRKLSL